MTLDKEGKGWSLAPALPPTTSRIMNSCLAFAWPLFPQQQNKELVLNKF